MQLRIRRCRPGEAERLTRLAHASKRVWGYPDHFLEEWRDSLTITPEQIVRDETWGAVRGEEPVGFYVLAPCGARAEVEHFWVAPEHIGSGVGGELLRHAMHRARAVRCRVLDITADPNAEGFYLRQGARRVGRVFAPVAGQSRHLPRLELALTSQEEGAGQDEPEEDGTCTPSS